ncbi:MAG: glutamate formimidoyltransferase [Bacteroidetes bacterium]|jgi:glutamate formiminotransferase|nr:glutamate formimidoyltransferase [Bacteroidota bacterium]
MSKILAAIPNVCEGRDQSFVDELTARLQRVSGLVLMDVSRDASRNRTVYSFSGSKEALFEGGLELYRYSLGHIDMRKHEGEYPRVGAVDVFPFVPLKDVTIEEATQMAREFAEKVAAEFKLPVYLFAESATRPQRRNVDDIREGEYEGFEEKMKQAEWKPDLGPERFPHDSGVTIIGARHPLVSFRVELSSRDESIARKLAEALETSGACGNLVNANPGHEPVSNRSQITISITNFRQMPMYRVIEQLRMEGRRYGVAIRKVEMIGLIPEIVFVESALYYMGVHEFNHDRILERNIQQHMDEKLFLE